MKVFILCEHNDGTPEANEIHAVFLSRTKALAYVGAYLIDREDVEWDELTDREKDELFESVWENEFYLEEFDAE